LGTERKRLGLDSRALGISIIHKKFGVRSEKQYFSFPDPVQKNPNSWG
jgi:hypothetical protein